MSRRRKGAASPEAKRPAAASAPASASAGSGGMGFMPNTGRSFWYVHGAGCRSRRPKVSWPGIARLP